MKNFLLIISLIFSIDSMSQQLVKSINVNSDWGTNQLNLYDDSTFTYINGGCTYIEFSIGDFTYVDKQFILHPKEVNSIIIITEIEKVEIDSCSRTIDVDFISSDGIRFGTDHAVVEIEDGNKWARGGESTEDYSVRSSDVMIIDTITYKNVRPDCKDYALCLIGYSNVFGRRVVLPISETTAKVKIYCPFPNNIIGLSMIGNLHYKQLEDGYLTIGGDTILIKNK